MALPSKRAFEWTWNPSRDKLNNDQRVTYSTTAVYNTSRGVYAQYFIIVIANATQRYAPIICGVNRPRSQTFRAQHVRNRNMESVLFDRISPDRPGDRGRFSGEP